MRKGDGTLPVLGLPLTRKSVPLVSGEGDVGGCTFYSLFI